MIKYYAKNKAHLGAAFRAAWEASKSLPDGQIEIIVMKYSEPRSPDQIALYYGIVGRICDETGNDRGQIDALLREKFFPPVVLNGEVQKPSLSIAKKSEMMDFLDKVIAYTIGDLHVDISDMLIGRESGARGNRDGKSRKNQKTNNEARQNQGG